MKSAMSEAEQKFENGFFTEGEWFCVEPKKNLEELRDKEFFKRATGRKELLKHVKGEKLAPREAIIAMCCYCKLGYRDEDDWSCHRSGCPLYPFMPYRVEGKNQDNKQ